MILDSSVPLAMFRPVAVDSNEAGGQGQQFTNYR